MTILAKISDLCRTSIFLGGEGRGTLSVHILEYTCDLKFVLSERILPADVSGNRVRLKLFKNFFSNGYSALPYDSK